MTAALNQKTLVLNKNWQAISVTPAFHAIMKVHNERAKFVDPDTCISYDFPAWVETWSDSAKPSRVAADKTVRIPDGVLLVPEIIVLKEYGGIGFMERHNRIPKLSRNNIALRDRFECQYCGRKLTSDEMTIDHVVPISKSGKSTWLNMVCCCNSCNLKKSNHSLEFCGMKLLRKPFIPIASDLRVSYVDRILHKAGRVVPKSWNGWLSKVYCDMELSENNK